MDKGYIPLFRKITENWVWNDKPFSKGQAWIDLLLRCNNTDEIKEVALGNKVFHLEPGELIVSLDKLQYSWGWGQKKVRLFLEQLNNAKMVSKKGTKKGIRITLLNQPNYKNWVKQKGTRRAQGGHGKRDKRVINLNVDWEKFTETWNSLAPDLPGCKIRKLTDNRKKKILLRIEECGGKQEFFDLIHKMWNIDFFHGNNNRGWTGSLDWLIKNEDNIVKLAEDKYD